MTELDHRLDSDGPDAEFDPGVDARLAREMAKVQVDWGGPKARMPVPFVLVGYDSPYVFPVDGRDPLVVDADGVVFLSGEVFTWCHTGCCTTNPRRWDSVEQAANAHGSYVIGPDGNINDPEALGPDIAG